MPTPSRPSFTGARWLRYALTAFVVAGLATLALWPSSQRVDSTSVAQGTVRESFDAEGRTRVRDRYVITAPVAGWAERITWEPGDAVNAQQVLLTLKPLTSPTLDASSRAQAMAQIRAAQALLEAAKADALGAEESARLVAAEAARVQLLAEQGMVSKEALQKALTLRERSALEARSARFREATAHHHVLAAQAVLQNAGASSANAQPLVLTSPVDGMVLKRHFQSERPVQAGEPLLEVGNPQALEVEVDVLSADAVRLRPGMGVELLRWGGGPALRGEVRRIEPGAFTKVSALGVEEQRVWVIVDLLQPPQTWAGLGEGYRVHARFVLRESDNTLYLPTGALFRPDATNPDAGWAVFRIEGSRARRLGVQVGMQGEGRVEILEGLAADDHVVLHPPRELGDGTRVHSP